MPTEEVVLHHYRLFGLHLATTQPLASLSHNALPTAGASSAEVHIEHGHVPTAGLDQVEWCGAYCQAAPGVVWLHIPEVAHFLVEQGKRIVVMPAAGVDPQTLELYLLGNVFGALLHQRGYLVLHGNVLVRDGRAIAICGHSGAGKSTLSAALLTYAGYSLVSDDLCVLNAQGQVQSGYPELKLWCDVVKALELPIGDMQPVRAQLEKYSWPMPERFQAEPVKLDAIYVLGSDNRADEPTMEAVQGMAKLTPLKAQIYRRHLIEPLGLTKAHFMLTGKLLGQIALVRVERQLDKPGSQALQLLAERVAEDAMTRGAGA